MERHKILIGCNLLTEVKSMAYPNHMQFWCNVARKFDNDQIIFFSPRRVGIDRMRNEAARMALEYECTHLFFYDDDVLLPSDTLDVLLKTMEETKAKVVGGVTQVRGYPFKPMIFKYAKRDVGSIWSMTTYEDYEDHVGENGIVSCDAVGFSCCLIDTSVLRLVEPPYFVTGPENTEDVYFCHKINVEFEDKRIVVDTKIATGHILDHYYISPGNKKHFQKLELGLYKQFPGMIDTGKKREDRDAKYREQVMERLRRVSSAQ